MADDRAQRRGFVHVYTGDGKGKTTAAFGLAMRAAGHGRRVIVLQFMKADPLAGVTVVAQRRGIEVAQCGLDHWVVRGEAGDDDRAAADAGLARAREVLRRGDHDLVVLDELITSVFFELVSVDGVLALLRERPVHVELVLTGRRCPPEIEEAADLVTEMRPVKHYYDAGVEAREGIEF